jgi:hypothetical protein
MKQKKTITKTRSSRFNLIDLAGSERQKSTEAIFVKKKNDILNRQNEFFQVKQKQLKDLKDQMKHITFS